MPTDERIDALFAGPADGFVAARDALVKQLKSEGHKDLAAQVKALRRPTVAAWAVNQVARTAKKEVARLVQIGDRLRDAHEALLEGKGDGAVREATAERRKLVTELTKQAVHLLGAGGDAQAEAITHTFDAAVADPEAAMAVREGRLAKELEAPSGFGGGLVFGSSEAAAPRASSDVRRTGRRSPRGAGSEGRSAPPPHASDADASATAAPDAERAAAEAEVAAEAEAAAAKEAERRELERDAVARAAEAQQATREADAAREEVSRLQDLLAAAEARAEAAAEHARVVQSRASTALRALRHSATAE